MDDFFGILTLLARGDRVEFFDECRRYRAVCRGRKCREFIAREDLSDVRCQIMSVPRTSV
ncbi:hypothetical protein [Gloeocapsopsis crepidinum]|uniref:hypothetical protein n=1 Tax=Gloeocapsopsis crepidinum TaxID=693223 RepID=UPI00187E5272|nr:hypothetical protein [Gloeocapsopsis crepidinum]